MFELLDAYQVETLHVFDKPETQLKAIIAIHDTYRGPALGGCRFIHYDKEELALEDAVKLARGMSYKAALADVPQGGGKAVIMKPKGAFDPDALFSSFARCVESLDGRYITAIDSGTSAREMDIIASQTNYVTSTSAAGDPSPYTALGVFEGIRAAVKHRLHRNSLEGLRIAVQGVGHVGYTLGKLLDQAGATVIVSDINQSAVDTAVRDFASEVVSPDEIHKVPCSVFAPCGLSNVINDDSIQELGCMIIAGSANVQLAHDALGELLHDKGILYVPDYVINSGGLIYASSVYHSLAVSQVQQKVRNIYQTLSEIFDLSDQKNLPTNVIADQLAQARIAAAIQQAA